MHLFRSRPMYLLLAIVGCSSSTPTPTPKRDAGSASQGTGGTGGTTGTGGTGGMMGTGGTGGTGGMMGTGGTAGTPGKEDGGAPAADAAPGGGGGPSGLSIELTDPADSMLYAPSTGGSDFTDGCMPGQVITGLRGTSGGMFQGLNTVEAFCADLAVNGDGPFDVVTRPNGLLGPHGMVGPTMYDGSCPANQVVVGFDGQSGNWIDALTPYCAPVAITGTPGAYTVEVGTPPGKLTTIVGDSAGGAPFPAIFCPEGKVAVGIAGGSGAAVDRFGLHCATLRLVP